MLLEPTTALANNAAMPAGRDALFLGFCNSRSVLITLTTYDRVNAEKTQATYTPYHSPSLRVLRSLLDAWLHVCRIGKVQSG